MTILFNGNEFKYEMENVARLFFPLRHFQFEYEKEERPEGDYLIFTRTEAADGGADLRVDFRMGEKEDSSLSHAAPSGRFENDCEEEFARMLYRMLEKYTGIHPRWGILTGIRPVHRMQYAEEQGKTPEEIKKEFCEQFYVSEEKYALVSKIEELQRPVLAETTPKDFSFYVSIPYCPSRCSYCSFVSHSINQPRAKKLIPDYVDCLTKEIAYIAEMTRECGLNLRSIYIGGGTPTSLSAEDLRKITDSIRTSFAPPEGLEYTIEAGRADTITREKLQVIKDAGATRISINPQSFEDHVLKAVGRKHTAQDVEDCYRMAQDFHFQSINMDLIAGLPEDTPEGFERSLARAISLDPENITVHALSVKRAAKLYSEMDGSEDYSAVQQMVDHAGRTLPAAGYEPYYLYRQKNTMGNLENVGYAKPGHVGLYNIYIMEEAQHILAAGAGGVSKVVAPGSIQRVFNYKYPYEYISGFADILSRKEKVRALLEEVEKSGH